MSHHHEHESDEIQLRICYKCPSLNGENVVTKRKRCPLCGRIADKYVAPSRQGKGKVKLPKGAKRFPREIAADQEQSIIMDIITNRTRDFDCPGKVIDIRKGPMVTQYKFQPDRFTRLKKLKTLNEDLALALSADSVTVTRIAGEAAIGIAVPNKDRRTITFEETLKNVIAHKDDMELPINFGITATGEPYIEDLARLPHLLVAGSTGTGKSVFLNNILTSLLYVRSPKQLQLILIDPKSVELLPYRDLPHLKQPPTADVYEALGLLERMVQEVRRRTSNLYTMGGLKNIKEYNDRVKKQAAELKTAKAPQAEVDRKLDEQWPYIVVVIDEMADLVIQEKKLFTEKMAAISAMARAAGIHVIAATQRPSVDVLSGKIKVNFPARVAFRVPSTVDSKTILGHKGAEQLLGKGDMFYVSPDKSGMQRIHAPKVEQADIQKMLDLSIKLGHVLSVPADGLEEKTPPPTAKKVNGKPAVQ